MNALKIEKVIEKIRVTTTAMTVHTSLKKGVLGILTLILMPLISACNAFAPSETTLIATTLNPSAAYIFITDRTNFENSQYRIYIREVDPAGETLTLCTAYERS